MDMLIFCILLDSVCPAIIFFSKEKSASVPPSVS